MTVRAYADRRRFARIANAPTITPVDVLGDGANVELEEALVVGARGLIGVSVHEGIGAIVVDCAARETRVTPRPGPGFAARRAWLLDAVERSSGLRVDELERHGLRVIVEGGESEAAS